MLSKEKQDGRAPFPGKFAVAVFSELKLQSQHHFLDLNAKAKKTNVISKSI